MVFWIAVVIGGVLIDLLTSQFLFCAFSIGSIGALIGKALGIGTLGQIIIFCVISILLIVFLYPVVKKKLKESTKRVKTMEEEYIGKTYKAEETIEETGLVKISGVYWTGINKGEKILKGDEFKVIGIEGSKLKIEKKRRD
ncbi:MAG: NfeD family protein [Clostridium sp.]|uniref:NfeD family protein n=1 Tax=Clostridium sp. TaxID=1506 RepID=UPI003EE792E2